MTKHQSCGGCLRDFVGPDLNIGENLCGECTAYEDAAREEGQVNALIDEVARLQAIVDELDTTADGVPVVRGMKVYQRTPAGDIGSYDVGSNSARDDSSCPYGAYLVYRLCFSTPDAVVAAEAETAIPRYKGVSP